MNNHVFEIIGNRRLPGGFGQVVHQQAVGLVLAVEQLHDTVQVRLLARQQYTWRVYLCVFHHVALSLLQGLQQGVHFLSPRSVGMIIHLLPSDDTLAG